MDDLPRDIAGRGGSEEHGQPLDIFREAHPVHGGLPGESLDDFEQKLDRYEVKKSENIDDRMQRL